MMNLQQGTVKRFFEDRGFGFISVPGQKKDVFFHQGNYAPFELCGQRLRDEKVELSGLLANFDKLALDKRLPKVPKPGDSVIFNLDAQHTNKLSADAWDYCNGRYGKIKKLLSYLLEQQNSPDWSVPQHMLVFYGPEIGYAERARLYFPCPDFIDEEVAKSLGGKIESGWKYNADYLLVKKEGRHVVHQDALFVSMDGCRKNGSMPSVKKTMTAYYAAYNLYGFLPNEAPDGYWYWENGQDNWLKASMVEVHDNGQRYLGLQTTEGTLCRSEKWYSEKPFFSLGRLNEGEQCDFCIVKVDDNK